MTHIFISGHKRKEEMKRLLICACILAALLVVAFIVFVAGLELGHRRDTTKDGVTASSTRSRRCIQLMTIRSGNGMIPRTPSYASVGVSLSEGNRGRNC